PWDRQAAAPYDERLQRHCYIAGLHSLLGKPWFAGWFWHEWTTNPDQGGTGDLGYSPKNKPAQEVLRRWFAAIGSQRGIAMPTGRWHKDIYGWASTDTSLDNLAGTGAEWVTIVPVGWMDDTGADYGSIAVLDESTHYPASPSDAALEHVIERAHWMGLKVVLKPHVDCINGAFRGLQDPQGFGVLDDWFDDYLAFITRYAQMAEQESCELLCLGTELNNAADDDEEIARWRSSIIPAVRQAYSGPIFFAELCLDPDVQLDLWEDLDFVGVNAYLRVFDEYHAYGNRLDTVVGQIPDTARLARGENPFNRHAWKQEWLPLLTRLRDTTDKMLIFPEIGYRSMDSCAYWCGDCHRNGWNIQYSGTTADLHAVCFPADTITGYAVGTGGVILKRDDSGDTWSSKSSGTSNALYALSFPKRNTGYAVGADATILKTEDGWENRMEKAVDGQHAAYRGVCFPLDPDTGYVVGDGGIALRTLNGGDVWSLMSVGTTAGLRSVDFPSRDIGFIVGDSGLILKTTDGGSNWSRCNSPTKWTLHAVRFRSPDTGYAVGDSGTCLYTLDTGKTWLSNGLRYDKLTLRAIAIPESLPGRDSSTYIVGDTAKLLRAVNLAQDWTLDGMQQWYPVKKNYNGVAFPNNWVGFVVGDSGLIMKTSEGGRMRIDWNEQVNCYAAAFQAFWHDTIDFEPLPWFYGFHWWDWGAEGRPKQQWNAGWVDAFTPHQKPAQGVLETWFAARPEDPGPYGHHVRHFPTGSLDVVVPENGKVNVPLVHLKLESRSWEGGGPADQARLLQEYYGNGDTVIKLDSTDWFDLGQQTTFDTEWRFLFGEGRYRFYVQFLDYPDKFSPPYPDFEDMVVVFDTTAGGER
ncbi:MAG: YCF48-related protein, partial [candidate division WOR-3 bacterium]